MGTLPLMSENGNGGKKKRNLSPETREKLRQAALERHAQGKLGGAKYGKMGGRPKKDRAASHVAEEARKKAKEITQVFEDAIDPNQPIAIRLKAAEAWLGVEREDEKLALQENVADAEQMSRDELIATLREKMTRGATATILRHQLEQENVVDAEVVDGD